MNQQVQSTTRPLVLVLEDDPSMRECFHALFEHLGYTVVAGSNGFDGVHLLQKMLRMKRIPDVIVSDVVMEGLDGLQFMRTVQAEYPWRNIPVVLVSGFVDGFAKARFLRNEKATGRVAFVPKPFEIQELVSAIEKVTAEPVKIVNSGH
jgi:CheY-like chemotaxis protein